METWHSSIQNWFRELPTGRQLSPQAPAWKRSCDASDIFLTPKQSVCSSQKQKSSPLQKRVSLPAPLCLIPACPKSHSSPESVPKGCLFLVTTRPGRSSPHFLNQILKEKPPPQFLPFFFLLMWMKESTHSTYYLDYRFLLNKPELIIKSIST